MPSAGPRRRPGRPGAAGSRRRRGAAARRESGRPSIRAVVLDGLTAREAARLLRVPVSSAKTRLYRAKAVKGEEERGGGGAAPAGLAGPGAARLAAGTDPGRADRGVDPEQRVTLRARTAALCAVALVPFACGCLALLRFVQLIPASSPLYGPFSPSARVAVLVGQIVDTGARRAVARGRARPLGPVPGRRVRAVPAPLRLGHPGDHPVHVAPELGLRRGAAAVRAVRLLHLGRRDQPGVTAWRGSPWFFIGWQLALCAIAVLVALLRGAEGRVRTGSSVPSRSRHPRP